MTLTNIPAGGVLSAGEPCGDTWVLEPAELDGLTLTVPDAYADAVDVGVTAITTESNGGHTAVVRQKLAVTVS